MYFSTFQVQTLGFKLTRLFGGTHAIGSSLGIWAFTGSNPLLPIPVFGDSQGARVSGAQNAFLRMLI